MACDRYQEELTAWADGELALVASMRVRLHLVRCRTCADAAAEVRRAIAAQAEWLTCPVVVDTERLLAETRRSLAALGTPRSTAAAAPAPPFAWGRAAFAGIGAAVLLVGSMVVIRSGGVHSWLVPLGIEAPPAQVVRNAELFRDYDIIRELEVLENFEKVNRVSLDDERAEASRLQFG